MIPAAFGVITTALETLAADLDDEHLEAFDDADLAAIWYATGAICRAADDLYDRLRRAIASEISDAFHGRRP